MKISEMSQRTAQWQTIVTKFDLVLGVTKKIANANPSRWNITITVPNGVVAYISPDSKLVAEQGMTLSSTENWKEYNWSDSPSLCCGEWFAIIDLAGITHIEVWETIPAM